MALMYDKDVQTSCNNSKTNNKMGNKTSTDGSLPKSNSNTNTTNEIGNVQNNPCAAVNGSRQKSSRNPYLNFLRDFRRGHSNLPAVEVVRRGAQEWHSLSPKIKKKYVEEASLAPKVEQRKRKQRRRRC